FEERALFLHDDHHVKAADEVSHVLIIKGPRTGHLEQPHAEISRPCFIYAQIIERLPDIKIAGAYGDVADLWIVAAGKDNAVEAVLLNKGSRGLALVVVQPLFLSQLIELVPDMKPAWRQIDFRALDADPVQADIHRSRGFDIVLHAFQRGPCAREAR